MNFERPSGKEVTEVIRQGEDCCARKKNSGAPSPNKLAIYGVASENRQEGKRNDRDARKSAARRGSVCVVGCF